jgi:hypothetical protein
LALWVFLPACLPDRCKTESANIELTVEFSGFDLGRAHRLEFETLVHTDSINPAGGTPPYYEKRLGSIAWPGAPDGKRRFLIKTGSYLNHLPEGIDQAIGFRIIIRVYSEEGALLGEGQYYEANVEEKGCYIEKSARVTDNPTCKNKQEGDPCVSPDGSAPSGVCQREGEQLRCRPSTCGDGFTDRRGGEICDHADQAAPCTADCLISPLAARIPADATGIDVASTRGRWEGTNADGTPTFGYFSVGADREAVDLAGTLLAADLDGDGVDELALGLPGARRLNHADCNQCLTEDLDEKVGVVYLNDYPMNGTESYGKTDRGLLNLEGPYSAGQDPGSWFGAALAAGDVDGDGIRDLLAGAPHFDTDRVETGAFYLLFGGPAGAIPPNPEPTHRPLTVQSDSDYRLVVGEQGAYTEQPGDHLGYAMAVADFDLDGIADIAVAAPHRKAPVTTSKGEVYLIRGRASLRPDVETPTSIADLVTRRLEVKSISQVRLGVSLATGDVNADGYPDLVMGTAAADEGDFHGGIAVLFGGEAVFERNASDVFFLHPPDYPATDQVRIEVAPDSILTGLGGAVQVVDVNGDGFGDVVSTVGRVGLEPPEGIVPPAELDTVALIDGRFFVQQLAEGADDGAQPGPEHLTLITGPPASGFGAVLGAVDVSGDHRPDLLISAPRESLGPLAQAGSVYALLSTPRGTWWTPGETLPQEIDLLSLRSQPALQSVPVPLIWLQGGTDGGHLGVALAGSSHLSQLWSNEEVRYAYTYVLEAGVDAGSDTNAGRVHSLFFPAALPCEATYPCVDAPPPE